MEDVLSDCRDFIDSSETLPSTNTDSSDVGKPVDGPCGVPISFACGVCHSLGQAASPSKPTTISLVDLIPSGPPCSEHSHIRILAQLEACIKLIDILIDLIVGTV